MSSESTCTICQKSIKSMQTRQQRVNPNLRTRTRNPTQFPGPTLLSILETCPGGVGGRSSPR
eukprot:1384376-Rhodomonas_salina.2